MQHKAVYLLFCKFALHFTNTCTCESHNIIVNTLNVKNKPLKLLELQHVSVFHQNIFRVPLVPVKVYLLPIIIFQSMLAACPILFVMGLDFMLLVLLVLISCFRMCHAWYNPWFIYCVVYNTVNESRWIEAICTIQQWKFTLHVSGVNHTHHQYTKL